MSSDTGIPSRSKAARYRNSLWLLTKRDLRVRYSTNILGYVWSVLDPLAMAGIYYFVFVVVFQRGGVIGEEPYIVFLLSGLLPWMWFNGSVSDSTRAFLRDAKLVRSTSIPRSIWVGRIVLSKGIEYVAALPVLAIFIVLSQFTDTPTTLTVDLMLFPLAIVLQAVLCLGLGLVIAPLVVFFRDLERAVKLILRFLFYASPIIYGLSDLPSDLEWIAAFNPLAGIFSLYRSAFFPEQLHWYAVGVGAGMTLLILAVGIWVFRRSERLVLKEL